MTFVVFWLLLLDTSFKTQTAEVTVASVYPMFWWNYCLLLSFLSWGKYTLIICIKKPWYLSYMMDALLRKPTQWWSIPTVSQYMKIGATFSLLVRICSFLIFSSTSSTTKSQCLCSLQKHSLSWPRKPITGTTMPVGWVILCLVLVVDLTWMTLFETSA